jgi:Na+/H+ ion antiporter subunit
MLTHGLKLWLAWWVTLWALYVLLVFKTELAEFVAGAVCAALGATATELVRRRGKIRFAPGVGWLRLLPALGREIVVDTVRLVPLVWRALRGERIEGRTRVIRFPDAARPGVEGASRRAVEKFLGSASPNSYVVGFDQGRRVVVVHQLLPTEKPPRCDWGER